jgi:hypothetical protein
LPAQTSFGREAFHKEGLMAREPQNTHFHIHWTKKKILDWEPFDTGHEALSHALELARPTELFTIEEFSVSCANHGATVSSRSRPEGEPTNQANK